jgi:hypothetical protein
LPLLHQEKGPTWGAMTSPPHHLLTLWSRSYAADAMDEHLAVLPDWAGRWRMRRGHRIGEGHEGGLKPCEPWFGKDRIELERTGAPYTCDAYVRRRVRRLQGL